MELTAEMAETILQMVGSSISILQDIPAKKHLPDELARLRDVINLLRATLVDGNVSASCLDDAASRHREKLRGQLYDTLELVERVYAAAAKAKHCRRSTDFPRSSEIRKMRENLDAAANEFTATRTASSEGNDRCHLGNESTTPNYLSFCDLPSPLKRSFALSAFLQRIHEMDKRQHAHLWIAHGLDTSVRDDESFKSLEEAAEDRFATLQKKSFLIDIESDFRLVQAIAADEMMAIDGVNADTGITVRKYIYHLFINLSNMSLVAAWIDELPPQLRSFIKVPGSLAFFTKKICARLFSHLKVLRVLDLNSSNIKIVPQNIGSLKQLRYLNLSHNHFNRLPDSITKLAELQVLDLSSCKLLVELPRRLRRLISLRHLYLGGCAGLMGMPVGLSKMTNLQTLDLFAVGKGHTSCQLSELGSMNLKSEIIFFFPGQPITEAPS